jgi:hypothetical protein
MLSRYEDEGPGFEVEALGGIPEEEDPRPNGNFDRAKGEHRHGGREQNTLGPAEGLGRQRMSDLSPTAISQQSPRTKI